MLPSKFARNHVGVPYREDVRAAVEVRVSCAVPVPSVENRVPVAFMVRNHARLFVTVSLVPVTRLHQNSGLIETNWYAEPSHQKVIVFDLPAPGSVQPETRN